MKLLNILNDLFFINSIDYFICCRVRSFLVLTVTQMTQNLRHFRAAYLVEKENTRVHAWILWVAASPICIVTFTIGSVQHN